ncbi:MAG: diheme cytochrome c [Mariprofundaceae bacterium]|nr:diheme cytochrome c [Mariprofundaceae bacterium]
MMIRFLILFTAFFTAQAAFASDNFFGIPRFKGVKPVFNSVYKSNCAECHFAYFPGLLPARSWKKLLAPKSLENHFGENAEMDESDRRDILDFLVRNSADDSHYKRSIKIRRSLRDGSTPLRITDVPYIKHKHSEIPAKLIKGNKKVRSLSYCVKCHREAKEKGIFDDDTVVIPGYPSWDD